MRTAVGSSFAKLSWIGLVHLGLPGLNSIHLLIPEPKVVPCYFLGEGPEQEAQRTQTHLKLLLSHDNLTSVHIPLAKASQ